MVELGVVVIHADEVAREVLAPSTPGAEWVARRWPDVVTEGVVDRAALGRLVFSDPQALAALEAITHPETRERIHRLVDASRDQDIAVEMPILRDWFSDEWVTVVVDAPEQLRIERVQRREAEMTREDVAAVMERQPSRASWLLAADFVVDNGGSIAQLCAECERVLALVGAT